MCSRLRLRDSNAAALFFIKRSCRFAWAVRTASDWGFSSGISDDLTMTGFERARDGVNAGTMEGLRTGVKEGVGEGAWAGMMQGDSGGDCLIKVSWTEVGGEGGVG